MNTGHFMSMENYLQSDQLIIKQKIQIQFFGRLRPISEKFKMQSLTLPLKIQNLFVPLVIIFIAAVLRIIPHPANVAPIAAMALFGGVYLNKKYALVVPLLALFISDIFLGFHITFINIISSFPNL